MSEENVEVVRKAGEAWERGGVEALLESASPDIEWSVRADMPDHAGTYKGHDGVRQLFAAFEEVLEDQGYEPLEFIDAGERVAMVLRWWGRGKGSGVEVEEGQGETWVFTVRYGKVISVQEYATKEEALQALGLE